MFNHKHLTSILLLVLLLAIALNNIVFWVLKVKALENANEYIIYFDEHAQLFQVISTTQCIVENVFWNIKAVLARCTPSAISIIKSFGFSTYPNINISIHSTLSSLRVVGSVQRISQGYGLLTNVTLAWSWAVSRVAADIALRYLNASIYSINIAILDTGIDPTHPLLAGKLVGWIEFDRKGRPVCSEPHDTYGHGTWVASIAAGGDGKRYVFGVAPNAKILSALVLPAGYGTSAQVLAGLDWVLKPYDCRKQPINVGRVNVVSMSFGASGNYSNVFLPAIEKLIENGIVAIAAIGNDGPYTSSNPGNIWGVIGVGATNFNDNVAWFSSFETVEWPEPPATWPFKGVYPKTYEKPDVVAPGVDVPGAFPGGLIAIDSGTSASTPIVAGVAAVVSEILYRKGLSGAKLVEAVYDVITSTTDFVNGSGSGKGLVNAFKAIAKALNFNIYSINVDVYPSEATPMSKAVAKIYNLYKETALSIYIAGVEIYKGLYRPGTVAVFTIPPTHIGGNEVIAVGIEKGSVYYGKKLIKINPDLILSTGIVGKVTNISSGEILNILVAGIGIGDIVAVYIGNNIVSFDISNLRGGIYSAVVTPFVAESNWYNVTLYDFSNPNVVLQKPLYISSRAVEVVTRIINATKIVNTTHVINNTYVKTYKLYTLLPLHISTKSYYVVGEESYIEVSSPVNISIQRVEIFTKPSDVVDVEIVNISNPYNNLYRIWIKPVAKKQFSYAEAVATIYVNVNESLLPYTTTLTILWQSPEKAIATGVNSTIKNATKGVTNIVLSIAANVTSQISSVAKELNNLKTYLDIVNSSLAKSYDEISKRIDLISKEVTIAYAIAFASIAIAVVALLQRRK
ncbi:S8 family serine peptidase [Ignisphaera sp. 4213-co]|uniref:S8 family serine peptidase n=1 Tax=Ignisphaera cupida TaxID=3050454 RepID=A0ABD4Z8S3_9CREN|nr:S8 family serine peptidase [Ignisphaera sp. 4213-co]MDK6028675.1 S8 family serine peptidase [Ignisphaera sp. 4213-co]